MCVTNFSQIGPPTDEKGVSNTTFEGKIQKPKLKDRLWCITLRAACLFWCESQTKSCYLQWKGPNVVDIPDELAYVHYVVGGEVGNVPDVDVSLVRRGNGGFFFRL